MAEAQAWVTNDEPLTNAGKPLPNGRVGELVDILSELEPSEHEEVVPPSAEQKMPRPRFAAPGQYPSVQLTLRHRRFEVRDLGGLSRLAVEGQDVAFRRDRDAIAVLHLARKDHLGERVLQIALDHPLQGTRAISGIPALRG